MRKSGFCGGSVVKNPPANAGDAVSIPGEGNDIPLQYSSLANFVKRGAWGHKRVGHDSATRQMINDISL